MEEDSLISSKNHGQARGELDRDALGGLRRLFGVDGELPHVRGGRGVGVLEDAGLVRDVEEVLVCGPRLRGGLLDGDVLLGGVGEERLAAGEAVVEF